MSDRPEVPLTWQNGQHGPGYSEDQYGKRDWSGYLMPQGAGRPMYDPGGVGGAETPSLRSDPGWDLMTRLSRAFGVGSAAMSAPGMWKALTVPAASPLVGYDLWNAYRNIQQLNGDHPTQLMQQQWEDRLNKQMSKPANPLVDLFTGPPVR